MLADDPPAPASGPGSSTPEGAAWQERTGLTLRQAEELLDWLEANGVTRREVALTEEGCVVRWQG
jgi:hypothetical protein